MNNNHEDILSIWWTDYGISLADRCIGHFLDEYAKYRGRKHPPISGVPNYARALRLLDVLLSPVLDTGETTDEEREKRALGYFNEIVEAYFRSRYQKGCDYSWRLFSNEKVLGLLMLKIDFWGKESVFDLDGNPHEQPLSLHMQVHRE